MVAATWTSVARIRAIVITAGGITENFVLDLLRNGHRRYRTAPVHRSRDTIIGQAQARTCGSTGRHHRLLGVGTRDRGADP